MGSEFLVCGGYSARVAELRTKARARDPGAADRQPKTLDLPPLKPGAPLTLTEQIAAASLRHRPTASTYNEEIITAELAAEATSETPSQGIGELALVGATSAELA